MKRPPLLALSGWLYGHLLEAYPPGFRRHFAVEMAQVFRSLCSDTYVSSGAVGLARLWLPVLGDWALSALYQWWLRLSRRKAGNMDNTWFGRPDGIRPLSAVGAGLSILPFLLFGVSSMASRLEFFHTFPASLPLWQVLLVDPFLVFYGLVLIGLGAGLLAGFPRWALSYLGWALLFVWWWSDMRFYGYSVGWKIGLPLLAALLAPLLIRRSLQPLRRLFDGLCDDWTLLSLGLYILYAFVWVLSDENHSPYLMLFIAATTLVVALGAWGYFRSASPLRRVLALVTGLLLPSVLGAISDLTWNYQAYYGLPESSQSASPVALVFFAVLAAIMLGTAMLALRRARRSILP